MWFWFVAASAADPATDFLDALGRMQAAIDRVQDATFDLHQQEYVGGRMRDEVVMHVWYRPRNQVYMEWDDGQRLLWLPGENDDKMRIDPGRFLPNLSLSPTASLAMRGQRHSIHRVGLAPVADLFSKDVARILADRERLAPTVALVGPDTLYGRPARCFDATMRKDLEPALYGARVEVCLDSESWLPLRMRTWNTEDGALRLVETYGYENLKVDVGIPDSKFDPAALGF